MFVTTKEGHNNVALIYACWVFVKEIKGRFMGNVDWSKIGQLGRSSNWEFRKNIDYVFFKFKFNCIIFLSSLVVV